MPHTPNQKLALAQDFVLHTNQNIFLTGKAGTGKTTFLHQIKQSRAKRLIIVAPTGVAAINAGGITIHSLFQLPFGPIVPGVVQKEARRFSREKVNLLRTLDLLIIDEISMVRADVLDGIDDVLRRYRNNDQPFGGVQLLLIGDMQQLSPVIRDEDWALLSPYYETGYFFGSRALRQTAYVSIELTHIYRQSDERFINLLNSIREKRVTAEQFTELNQRYIANFTPPESEGYITLATHNTTAQQINSQKLIDLKAKLHTFEARIENDFPTQMYPTEANLGLKVGAQVMFIRNDTSREKLYYNGKIGRITAIEDEVIHVKSASDGTMLYVGPADWDNIRYTLDPATKEIKSEVIGRFTQYPLKLAWAITVHKSQGLTFEKVILDVSAAFAHGQVYVALSRCKTFDGLVLRSPIPAQSIKSEWVLEEFQEQVQQQTPTERQLQEAKRLNQVNLIRELISFEQAHSLLHRCRKLADEQASSLDAEVGPTLFQLGELITTKARDVSRRFDQQLRAYFNTDALPEENPGLQQRLQKAGLYFQPLLTDELLPLLRRCPTDCDNKQIRDPFLEALDELERELVSKQQSFLSIRDGFTALGYLKARNHAELDFRPARKLAELATSTGPATGNLYSALMKWRNDLAGEQNASAYMVLPQKTIVELARIRPMTIAELATVKGFGKTKVKQIGDDVLRIIQLYSGKPENKEVAEPKPKAKKAKAPKDSSPLLTLTLFQLGKSIADIAAERNLAVSTIESHLSQAISAGTLSIEAVLPPDKLNYIRSYLEAVRPQTLGEARSALGNEVTYSEIRFVYNAMRAGE